MTKEEFQQAVKMLRPRLAEQALHYLADGEEAEDAVQDVLLRLWQMHEKLHPPIDGLAAVLTRNVCIDLLRRHHRSVDFDTITISETESDDHERIESLMEVMDSLPDTQQTLLRLRHMQGMEMKELASLLQMNEAAVRKALSRARIAVRKQYYRHLLMAGAVVLLVGVGALILFQHRQEDDYEAYIYGKRTTDREVVMDEMRRSIAGMAADNQENNVEQQLNEMFNIE